MFRNSKLGSYEIIKPIIHTTGSLEPYGNRGIELDKQFPGIKIKAPFVRVIKEHEPQDLNFDD